MTPEILDSAVREVASLQLKKVVGFAANASHHCFLIGLAPGAWVDNASHSKERQEVLDEILKDLTANVLPILRRHLPGKNWSVQWVGDNWGYFKEHGTATVLMFRWDE